MAEVEKFMRGPQPRTLVEVGCLTTIGIEKGDFVLIFRGNAYPPSAIGSAFSGAEVARREASMIFAGVARNSSPVGKTTIVQVDVSLESVYALEQCEDGALSVADLLGICAYSVAAGEWALYDQTVEADCSYPIAVCVQAKGATGSRLLAKLVPQKLFNPTHSYNICDDEDDLSFAG